METIFGELREAFGEVLIGQKKKVDTEKSPAPAPAGPNLGQ